MYMVSSGLVGRGLRLQIPEVSPASVAGIFRGGCLNCCFLKCWRLAVTSVLIVCVTSLLRCLPGGCPVLALID